MDEYEIKRRKRRERIRRKRRRQRAIRIGALIAIVIAIVVSVCVVWSDKRRKEAVEKETKEKAAQELQIKRLESAKAILDECYVSHLCGDKVVSTENKQTATFSEWFFEYHSEEIKENVMNAAEDGVLTPSDLYELTGESIYVLSDRYHGLLNDVETAAQNCIYIRDGIIENGAEITIAGDLCFAEDGFVLDHYDTVNDLEQCISPEILEITNQSDIFYLNHEYCISDRGEPLEGKYYTFRANPERMELLKQMGTDIVSLSNNHVFDYGKDALLDTTDLLDKAGIPYVGGGRNIEEAKRPIYFIVNGIKIGFVGASNGEKNKYTPQATEEEPGILRAYDTTEFNQVILEASKECDYLIAYIHWGTEDTNYYNADQERWGREFLSSGADIVIGGHPHVLQGMEYVDGKPIVYSLGDFWFNHETKYTGVLKLHISQEGLEEMSFVPCLQTNFTTQYLAAKEEQEEVYSFLEMLSPNIQIDSNGIITQLTE